jgi:hypothetical protein
VLYEFALGEDGGLRDCECCESERPPRLEDSEEGDGRLRFREKPRLPSSRSDLWWLRTSCTAVLEVALEDGGGSDSGVGLLISLYGIFGGNGKPPSREGFYEIY